MYLDETYKKVKPNIILSIGAGKRLLMIAPTFEPISAARHNGIATDIIVYPWKSLKPELKRALAQKHANDEPMAILQVLLKQE